MSIIITELDELLAALPKPLYIAEELIRTEKLKTKMDLLKTIRRSYPKKQTLLGNAQSKLTLADIDRLIGETKLEAGL